MTAHEAAERMNLSLRSVRELLKNGRLGCRRMGPKGGKIVITEEHLAAYVESCETAGKRGKTPKNLKYIRAPA